MHTATSTQGQSNVRKLQLTFASFHNLFIYFGLNPSGLNSYLSCCICVFYSDVCFVTGYCDWHRPWLWVWGDLQDDAGRRSKGACENRTMHHKQCMYICYLVLLFTSSCEVHRGRHILAAVYFAFPWGCIFGMKCYLGTLVLECFFFFLGGGMGGGDG